MDSERRRVVIGVTAFVWVREHHVRAKFVEQIGERVRELDEPVGGFAIDDVETSRALRPHSDELERGGELLLPRARIFFARRKALFLSVYRVAWRTVGHVHDERVR